MSLLFGGTPGFSFVSFPEGRLMGRRLKAGWEAHLSGKVDLWVSVLVLSRLLPTLAWNFFFVATTRGMSETGCIRDELGPCLASPLGCLDRGNSSEGGRSWPGDCCRWMGQLTGPGL